MVAQNSMDADAPREDTSDAEASRNDTPDAEASRNDTPDAEASRNDTPDAEGSRADTPDGRHPLFMPLVLGGGLLFGFGLAYSHMARPEVVLDFLQFDDLGLIFVMFGGAAVTGLTVFVTPRLVDRAPLTGDGYERRLKAFDRNVLVGGAIFGVGWGLSGICPGAAYASLGIGNIPILWALAGMFIGAYLQGYWRSRHDSTTTPPPGTN